MQKTQSEVVVQYTVLCEKEANGEINKKKKRTYYIYEISEQHEFIAYKEHKHIQRDHSVSSEMEKISHIRVQ